MPCDKQPLEHSQEKALCLLSTADSIEPRRCLCDKDTPKTPVIDSTLVTSNGTDFFFTLHSPSPVFLEEEKGEW
jgi:hypothetical protein